MIGIVHAGALPLADEDVIAWLVDIAVKLALCIVPGFSIKHGIVEFGQVSPGVPFAPDGRSPDHHIFFGRGMQQLHLNHHTASIVENPGLGIIDHARVTPGDFCGDASKHLIQGLPQMLQTDLMKYLGVKDIVCHMNLLLSLLMRSLWWEEASGG